MLGQDGWREAGFEGKNDRWNSSYAAQFGKLKFSKQSLTAANHPRRHAALYQSQHYKHITPPNSGETKLTNGRQKVGAAQKRLEAG